MRIFILYIKKVLVISASVLLIWSVTAQNLEPLGQDAGLSKKDQDLYNALYNTDCSIPEGTQVLHYPMLHMDVSNSIQSFGNSMNFEETIARSQWRLLQLIRQHPGALLFDEKFTVTKEAHVAREDFYKTVEKIHDVHPQQLSDLRQEILDDITRATSFEEIGVLSQKALYYGGSGIALHLGSVERLYPVTLLSSHDEMRTQYWKSINMSPENIIRRIDEIKEELTFLIEQFEQAESAGNRADTVQTFIAISRLGDEVQYLQDLLSGNHFQLQWREDLLFQSVHQTLSEEENEDKMVIIAYGVRHDLSDNFKVYNFYRLPYFCSALMEENVSFFNVFLILNIVTSGMGQFNKEIVSQFVQNIINNMPSEELQLLASAFPSLFVGEADSEIIRESFKTLMNHFLANGLPQR